MAERRMIAKTIIDSDAFLDMPTSTQNLYFHLSLRADDEGFINNPKTVMRFVKASDDDLNLLILKKFIIPFQSGVVVIKHWRIHNYIRADRLHSTKYQNEKAKLDLDENGAYRLKENCVVRQLSDNCQTTDGQVTDKCHTEVRLGKDRLGKVSIEGEYNEPKALPLLFEEIKDYFNSVCVSYPKIISLSDKRKKALKGLISTYSLEKVKEVFDKAEKSDFMKGTNDRKWSATFDWIINPTNFLKILEGNFDNKSNNSSSSFDTEEFFQAALKRGMEKYNG